MRRDPRVIAKVQRFFYQAEKISRIDLSFNLTKHITNGGSSFHPIDSSCLRQKAPYYLDALPSIIA